MTDPPQNEPEARELADLLIAISVVARHLARKIEGAPALPRGEGRPCRNGIRPSQKPKTDSKETNHEQDERTGGSAG